MALLQISEPGQSPEPHQRKRAIGIDLGTTNSLVATVRHGKAETIADSDGVSLLPSVVNYSGESALVGAQARARIGNDSHNTIASAKRMMGRGMADTESLPYEFVASSESGLPLFKTDAGAFSPVQVSADILRALSERGQEALGGAIDAAVVTVPAYFDDAQRQATKDAATLAGVPVKRLLNEPTAAAIAYGLDRGADGQIAVFDLGGGTFDISILRLSRGVFEVLSTGGDSALGGDDFDQLIVDWVLREAQFESDRETVRQLQVLARAAKEDLSELQQTTLEYSGWSGVLSRDQFVSLSASLVRRTILACKRALRDAGVETADIDNVVLVGGSTRMPVIVDAVSEFFGKPALGDINPDEVVAIGAALQADVLAGNKPESDMLLLDVIPLSLGLETMGGLSEKIVHRNTTIPVSRAQDFTTYKDGQTALALHVVQGERELVTDNRSLARFELRGIPPMVAGAAQIRVTFQVDADGLLSVSAREESSGVESQIQVKPSYGLSDDEITGMLRDSYAHAEQDRDARSLREQQVEADRMVESVVSALEADGEALLSATEQQALVSATEELLRVKAAGNVAQIKLEIEKLGKLSETFAARRMDQSIKRALQGQSLDELDSGE